MRIVLFGVVGLVVGIAAGTGVSALKHKKVLEAELQVRQDSLAAARADSLASVVEEEAALTTHEGPAGARVASTEPGGVDQPSAEGEPQGAAVGEEETSQEDPGAGPSSGGSAGGFAAPALSGGIGGLAESGDGGDAEAEGPRRLAKIFGAMDPDEAAAVLENLADGEVQTILQHISERKVAAILSNFEPARAATLSRVVMGLETGRPVKPGGGDGAGGDETPDAAHASGEAGGPEPGTGTSAAGGKAGGGG